MTDYVLELPTSEFPNYLYTIDLDGKEYQLDFRYDVFRSSWYLSISKTDGTLLLSGVRLVPWIDLLSQYTKEDLPLGQLYLMPSSYSYPMSPDTTLENLSTVFQLIYGSVT
jgi:hypothetical protein